MFLKNLKKRDILKAEATNLIISQNKKTSFTILNIRKEDADELPVLVFTQQPVVPCLCRLRC